MATWLGLLGALGLVVGVLSCLAAWRRAGLMVKCRGLLSGLVYAGLGSGCLAFALTLRAFDAVVQKTPAAEVRCRWRSPQAFTLTLTRLRQGTRQAPQTFELRGDQWSVSGGMVTWHPWLTALGLPSYHRLTRVSGRFSRAAQERLVAPTAFEVDGEGDWLWAWWYRLDPYLPFVEAAYGSAAFLPVDPDVIATVSVTPSGYLIERVRLDPRRASP
ncbi:MAG: hypothetical protein HYY91_06795 [Candidatus Omnitrophica bacterium]|nr:hypothetical protein [Candidatus Omnitrophota bacterium]